MYRDEAPAGIGHNGGPTTEEWEFDDPNRWGWLAPKDPQETVFICLTKGFEVALDYEDWLWASKLQWSAKVAGFNPYERMINKRGVEKVYAVRTITVAPGSRQTMWLHREITRRKMGEPPSPKHVSDHLDGDSLNCRRENLEWATLSQNAKNKFGSAWLQLRMPGV